jgi:hypothetical protein
MDAKYDIIFLESANEDIKNKDIDDFSKNKMVDFLKSDGCRIIGKRQQCPYPEKKIWYLRVPDKFENCGNSGGYRVLYYNVNDKIYISRMFKKDEVDDGKQKRKNVLAEAIKTLKDAI